MQCKFPHGLISEVQMANGNYRKNRPIVEEILAHPAYPDTIWKFMPTQSGRLPVAKDRGGPINIEWEVHGKGDIKLVVRLMLCGVVHPVRILSRVNFPPTAIFIQRHLSSIIPS